MAKKPWTRNQKLSLAGVVIAAVVGLGGWVWKSQAQNVDNRGGIYAPNQSGGTNIINHAPPRERDAFYQGGRKIGQGQQAQIDSAGKFMRFGFAGFTTFTDPSMPIEYNDLRLQCAKAPTKDHGVIAAQISIAVAGLDCIVLDKR
jgi:hypothetical protein